MFFAEKAQTEQFSVTACPISNHWAIKIAGFTPYHFGEIQQFLIQNLTLAKRFLVRSNHSTQVRFMINITITTSLFKLKLLFRFTSSFSDLFI